MGRNWRTCSFYSNPRCKANSAQCCSCLHPLLLPYDLQSWPQEVTCSLPQQFILSICKKWNTQTASVLVYLYGLSHYFSWYQWNMGVYLYPRDGKEPVNGCPSSHNQTRTGQKLVIMDLFSFALFLVMRKRSQPGCWCCCKLFVLPSAEADAVAQSSCCSFQITGCSEKGPTQDAPVYA